MKRRLVKPVVFLLLGAIVNVAVAWRCALFAHLPGKLRNGTSADQLVWPPYSGEDMSHAPIIDTWDGDGLCIVDRIADRFIDQFPEPTAFLRTVSAGWPVLSFNGEEINNRDTRWVLRPPTFLQHDHDTWRPKRLLPLRPIWPGFAINTLLYAAILWGVWLLFAAPFALRRRRHIKRGLCPKCAYDLRGCASQKCPECGNRVKATSVQPASA